jgi:hypothetical protein
VDYLSQVDGLGLAPIIIPKKTTDSNGEIHYVRAFEAADYYAFEARRAMQSLKAGGATRASVTRLLQRVPTSYGHADVGHLRSLCIGMKVPLRQRSAAQ